MTAVVYLQTPITNMSSNLGQTEISFKLMISIRARLVLHVVISTFRKTTPDAHSHFDSISSSRKTLTSNLKAGAEKQNKKF